ncbi:MAG: preprotein translocase subunit YajC [Alphaproteobacteria bacterium]|nr:preprotein translocase subunit YajC [Alphaproteobacteria bacterium]
MFNLISPAQAQSTGGMLGGFDYMSLMPLIFIFVAFYFFMIRPQQKKMQAQRDMLNAISRGDQVVTAGGIIGTVVKVVSDSEILLEIADKVQVRLIRGMITENLTPKSQASQASQASQGSVRGSPEPSKVSVKKKLVPVKKKPVASVKKSVSSIKKTVAPVKKAAPKKV